MLREMSDRQFDLMEFGCYMLLIGSVLLVAGIVVATWGHNEPK